MSADFMEAYGAKRTGMYQQTDGQWCRNRPKL